jgi:hypothetical protein
MGLIPSYSVCLFDPRVLLLSLAAESLLDKALVVSPHATEVWCPRCRCCGTQLAIEVDAVCVTQAGGGYVGCGLPVQYAAYCHVRSTVAKFWHAA